MAEPESSASNDSTAQDQSTAPVQPDLVPEEPAAIAAVMEPPLTHAVTESSVATEEPLAIANEGSPALCDQETGLVNAPQVPTPAEVVEQVSEPEEPSTAIDPETENPQAAADPNDPPSEETVGMVSEFDSKTGAIETNPVVTTDTISSEVAGARETESMVSSVTTDRIIQETEQPEQSTESHQNTVMTSSEQSVTGETEPQQISIPQVVRPISPPIPFLPVRTAHHHAGYAIRGLF